jgi:hypothetical protein
MVLPTGPQLIYVEEEERLEDRKQRACFYPGVNRKRHAYASRRGMGLDACIEA